MNNFKRLLIENHKTVKVFNIIILSAVGIMFFAGGTGDIDLPCFHKYSNYDVWVWTIVLYSLALVQTISLATLNCIQYYRRSNFILILSGISLLIVGCLFVLSYPPYSWQMYVFPCVGFILSLFGRYFNKTEVPKEFACGKIT